MIRDARYFYKTLSRLIQPILLLLFSVFAQAESNERTFCVWDPLGKGGPVVTLVKGAVPKSISWGIPLKMVIYTDERVAANDFKAGQCDAVMVTDVSTRDFNAFTSSVNAVGAIPSVQALKTVLATMANPKASPLMVQGQYEVAGILPVGSVFIYVRDKQNDNVESFQGKKMVVINGDPVTAEFVRRLGGSAVNASLANFSGKFNNGNVDILFAPAVAFETMELYKGMESGGGIIDFPILHSSLQIVIKHENFPEGYGQKMRDYAFSQLDAVMAVINKAEEGIPKQFWIPLSEDSKAHYTDYMRESRVALMEEGFYERKSLKLMRKVRCKHQPTASECVQSKE